MITKIKQKGVYAVEFAIVGSLFFVLFFAVIEFARVMFTWDVLTEVSRRGARLATVCHVQRQSTDVTSLDFRLINAAATPNDVLAAAIFSDADDDAKMIPNLTPENIKISYLDYAGNTATTFAQISLVRAEIINYQHSMFIPFFSITLNSPSFSTTLPRESLGVTRYGYTCNGTPL
jgi:Flp pilus assembly protein TadG